MKVLSWILLVASCIFIAFSLLVYAIGGDIADQGFVHPMRMHPAFSDLRYLIANSECGVNLDDYYRGLVVGCDPAGRTYRFDYPPMSIWIGRLLHVRGSHTPLIAVTTAVALVASVVLLIRRQLNSGWKWRLLAAGLLMSFPLQQALERGNLDVLLFLMVLLLAYILSGPVKPAAIAWAGRVLGSCLVFLMVSLKIYPLFAVFGLFVSRSEQAPLPAAGTVQWRSTLTKGLVLVASAAGFVPLISYFRTVGNLIKQGSLGSHGLMAFGYMNTGLIDAFGIDSARLLIKSLFVLKAASLLVGFVMAHRSRLVWPAGEQPSAGKEDPLGFVGLAMMMMACIWMGCYITTINYDYRFLYIIPYIGYLATLAASPLRSGFQARWPALLILAMLFVLLFPWLLLGYTPLGMSVVALAEPITEFVLIPVFAGSLLYSLLTNTALFERLPTSLRLQR